jgi:hypothetical protein
VSGPEDLQGRLEEIADQFRASRERAVERGRTLSGLSECYTDAKGTLSVTVGVGGTVRELRFLSQRYREMAPAELADLITSSLAAAQERVQRRMLEILPSTLLGGIDTAELLSGKADLGKLLPEELVAGFGPAGAGPGAADPLGALSELLARKGDRADG